MADAIFIVGYYRSGTSALSGALQHAGVKFYNEAAPNEHNPLGFFEIPELIEFDARLFSHLGVDWPDVRGLPSDWVDRADITPFSAQLEEIVRRRFSPEDLLWGLKHPHLCRALPLYERVARRAGHTPHVIHIFRDPWISAASQCYKNGLSRAHALLLWMTYATSAERQARHLPRTWLTYSELLADPVPQLRRIETELGLTFPQGKGDGLIQAGAYLNNQLDRSKPLSREQLCQPLEKLVERTWQSIQSRQFGPELWDDFAAETDDLVGFLSEIGSSKARALPSFGSAAAQIAGVASANAILRPTERTDALARQELMRMRTKIGSLPKISIAIVAPVGRVHAVAETLNSLNQQWEPATHITVLSADPLALEGVSVIEVPPGTDATTKSLCVHLNQEQTREVDYVAILNAGDTITPDACLRFALLAAQTNADMLYSDEIVPNNGNGWVRRKPGWDITRLRQAAYIGDWVWYKNKAVQTAGGFDHEMAGAEEYDLQLRFAAQNAHVERLPEALFTRSAQSRRDNVAAEVFCARALETLSRHLKLGGMQAEVQNRQYPGLFHHMRLVADPGTTIIMLCDGAEIPTLDKWLTGLLTGQPLTGPVILAGAEISPQMQTYLTAVANQQEALQGQVLAVIGSCQGEAVAKALGLAKTELVAFLDARMQDVTPHWQAQLRARLADQNVVAVAARTVTPAGHDGHQGKVMGPIILGADTRLGAWHGPLDPGPGGWLAVDQEASAITPPGLLVRRAALAGCQISTSLKGDALWIDLCAQLQIDGAKLVWTPDVSFVMPAVFKIDTDNSFRSGSPAARALPWADPYHHPALSLCDDLLAAEKRTALIHSTPQSPSSLLLTGNDTMAESVLDAGRTLRYAGIIDADWAPALPTVAEINRRSPAGWVRINPSHPPGAEAPPYVAVYTTQPEPEAREALAAATKIFATSPDLVKHIRSLAPKKTPTELWRPALSGHIWQDFKSGTGLNTTPRILWIDEEFAPSWLQDLITETASVASWMIVPQAGAIYSKEATLLPRQETERGWAELLATTGPQIFLRPAKANSYADCQTTLMAAAAGCRLIIDSRLDAPESLGALRLPDQKQSWATALQGAIEDLAATLQHGAKTRAAALALPTLEQAPPGWCTPYLLDKSEAA